MIPGKGRGRGSELFPLIGGKRGTELFPLPIPGEGRDSEWFPGMPGKGRGRGSEVFPGIPGKGKPEVLFPGIILVPFEF